MTLAHSSPVYLDTSALAKLYVPEPESSDLEAALVGRRDLVLSELALTELTSAVARRVREGDLTERDGRRLYQRAIRDLLGGEFRRVELSSEVHREAERILMSVGHRLALRAADTLHLGAAVWAGARVIVTYDARTDAAAAALGTLERYGLVGEAGPGPG